jgi:protein phosphatase
MALSLQAAARTDVGLVRSNNEDKFGYDVERGVFVVCDGMGGQACGELASQVGVETAVEFIRSHRAETANQTSLLQSAIEAANSAVRSAALEHADRTGMGTTIVALLFGDSSAAVAHVGDSRAYLLRNGTVTQLTEDHSLVAEQVRRGIITPEQAEFSNWQHVLLRALGGAEDTEIDAKDVPCQPGDIFLLATDGLTKAVTAVQLAAVIGSAQSLEQACEQLIDTANSAGGDDNATCLLVRVQ